jgi:hypothetical protein
LKLPVHPEKDPTNCASVAGLVRITESGVDEMKFEATDSFREFHREGILGKSACA